MLNKELLMGSLEPVLSIYISPALRHMPSVTGTLSTGKDFYVNHAGVTTFKFSEIELTEAIIIEYYDDVGLSTTNLMAAFSSYSGGYERVSSALMEYCRIADRTRSASISLS